MIDRAFVEVTAAEWHDIARLRIDVFVVEQRCAYPELDGRDIEPATRHVWIAGPDAGLPELPVASYARALAGPEDGTRIGRVVTHPSARGRGLARRLIDHLVRTTGGPWTLDAQARLADWYAGLGFSAAGEPFYDWDMLHLPMRLHVATDAATAGQSPRATDDGLAAAGERLPAGHAMGEPHRSRQEACEPNRPPS